MSLKYLITGATMGVALAIGACQTEEGFSKMKTQFQQQADQMTCEPINGQSLGGVIEIFSYCEGNGRKMDKLSRIVQLPAAHEMTIQVLYDMDCDGKVDLEVFRSRAGVSALLREENDNLFELFDNHIFKEAKERLITEEPVGEYKL